MPDDLAFERALQLLETLEGGWSDHAADRGGATQWGLSTRFLEGLIGRARYWRVRIDANRNGRVDPDEVRRLPRRWARAIYKRYFWDAYRCADVPAAVRPGFFCLVVHTTPAAAVSILQRAARRAGGRPGPPDGIMGELTIRGARQAATARPEELRRRCAAETALHYHTIATKHENQRTFLAGWFYRAVRMFSDPAPPP